LTLYSFARELFTRVRRRVLPGGRVNAMAEVNEKRLSPRVAVEGHVRYRRIPINRDRPRNAAVLDVGQGGFKFHSDEFLDRNSNMLVELHLPNSHLIRSLAMVAWVKMLPADGSYEIGGTFVEPTLQARRELERIVLEH